MKLNNEQIEVLEDKVINKIVYPLFILNKVYNEQITADKELRIALKNLTELYNWIYSLRS